MPDTVRSNLPPIVEGYKEVGQVIDDSDINCLIGKLLTYIDATYSDREQREAHKSLVKQTVYNWYNSHREYQGIYRIQFTYGENSPIKIPESFEWEHNGTTYHSSDIKVSGSTS
jgi:hypothetical protein